MVPPCRIEIGKQLKQAERRSEGLGVLSPAIPARKPVLGGLVLVWLARLGGYRLSLG